VLLSRAPRTRARIKFKVVARENDASSRFLVLESLWLRQQIDHTPLTFPALLNTRLHPVVTNTSWLLSLNEILDAIPLSHRMMSSPPRSEQMDAPSSQDEVLSPQLPTHTSPTTRVSRKERRQPSITPRRFSRFFDAQRGASMSSPSGRALKAIVNNRQSTQSSPLKCSKILEADNEENESPSTPREFKRRKRATGDSDLDEACLGNLAKRRTGRMLDDFSTSPFPDVEVQILEDVGTDKRITQKEKPTKRITPFENRGFSARLLQLSLGISRSRQSNLAYPVNGIYLFHPGLLGTIANRTPDWRDETASFYSRPEDVHHSRSLRGDRDSIPFCNAGLHSKPLGSLLQAFAYTNFSKQIPL
jgi:hypothetical protein